MKIKLSKIIIAIFALATILTPSLTPAVYADNKCDDICSSACNVPSAVKEANGCNGSANSTNAFSDTITNILTAIIGVLGLLAVIFIIIGGVNYMTSAGDAGKLKKAKDTILYACIGLIICALAFAIVNFVIADIIK